jgi:hypothetical protein
MADNPAEEQKQDTENARLEELRRVVPNSADSGGSSTQNEVTVVANANSYIEQLKSRIEELKQENNELRDGATASSSTKFE